MVHVHIPWNYQVTKSKNFFKTLTQKMDYT